jgi:hypothetical protein
MARESTIQIYNSVTGATCPADLSQGELAFAGGSGAGLLFIGKNSGTTAWIGAGILDEDNLVSDSAYHLATQQSIKAYVDDQVVSASSSGVAFLNGFTGAVAISADHGITFTTLAGGTDKIIVRGMTASTTQVGVAKFSSGDFTVTDGEVFFSNKYVYVDGDTGIDGATLELGLTLGIFGGTGLDVTVGKGAGGQVNVNINTEDAAADDTTKGVATFEADDFDDNGSGKIDLASSVVKTVNTLSGSVTPANHAFGISGGTAIETSGSGQTASIAVKQASTSQLGVASFSSSQFSVGTTGHVTLLGGADGAVLTVTGDADTGTKASRSGSDVTISGITASSSQMGTAKFDAGDFVVTQSTGVVSLRDGSTGAVIDIQGTAEEVDVSRSNGTVTVGLPANVNITTGLTVGSGGLNVGGDAIITGDLTVNGTTTTVNSTELTVDDPIIYLASGNQSNTKDIGFVADYDDGTAKYTGLVRDQSDSNKYKLFNGLTADPGNLDTLDLQPSQTATLVAKINAGTF